MRASEFLIESRQETVAYHGNQGGIHGELRTPMWWSTDKDSAIYYATQYGGDGTVFTAVLSCKNPYIVKQNDETNNLVEKYKILEKKGYDSIYDPRGRDWIPFHAKDIHITGKEYIDGEPEPEEEYPDEY